MDLPGYVCPHDWVQVKQLWRERAKAVFGPSAPHARERPMGHSVQLVVVTGLRRCLPDLSSVQTSHSLYKFSLMCGMIL